MASLYIGELHVYSPSSAYGVYKMYLKYDSVTRNGLTVTMNNARVEATRASSKYSTNRIAICAGIGGSTNNVKNNGTISSSGNASPASINYSLGNPSVSTTGTSFNFYVAVASTGASSKWDNFIHKIELNTTISCVGAYANITSFTVSKRDATSLTVNWGADVTCDALQYAINDGNWVGASGTSFVVSGLSPNTGYNIKIQVRRQDSQQWTASGNYWQSTYRLPTQTINWTNENQIRVSWSTDSAANYIWYSTNGGTNWVDVGSVNATSGSFTISGLAANTSYNVKVLTRRATTNAQEAVASATASKTKAIPTHSKAWAAETQIKVNYGIDSTADYLWWSKDNGATWNGLDITDGTSGSYTISSLSPNTAYNIKTRLRRKDSQTTYDIGPLAITTAAVPTQQIAWTAEKQIKVNWSSSGNSTKIEYQLNNGSWVTASTTAAASGSFTISSLTANSNYTIVTRITRQDSGTTYNTASVSTTTKKIPTNATSSKQETQIIVSWSADEPIDQIQWSKDNGASWSGATSVASLSSGTYTITGLTNNTNYKIKTRLRRKASQTTSDTSVLSETTYDYPHAISAPSFNIGDGLTIGFYNPLKREITVTIIAGGNNSTKGGDKTTGTSITGYNNSSWQAWWYGTIPNAVSSTYKVKVVYGSSERTYQGGSYTCLASRCKPTITGFSVVDTLTTPTGTTASLVKTISKPKISATLNKTNSAGSIKSYTITCSDGQTYTNSAGGFSAITYTYTKPVNGNKFTITCKDSRGFTSDAYSLTPTMYNYVTLTATAKFEKVTPTGSQIKVSFNGNYYNNNFGSDKPNELTIEYRFKDSSAADTDYSGWTTITLAPADFSGNTYKKNDFVLSDTFDYTKRYHLQLRVKDAINTTGIIITQQVISTPILWWNMDSFHVTGDEYVQGDIFLYKNSTTTTDGQQIKWKMGTNDYVRLYAAATASNAGYFEIATADDYNEPIYVRQYQGDFATLKRTLTLLDGSGNTSIPGTLTIATNSTIQYNATDKCIEFIVK